MLQVLYETDNRPQTFDLTQDEVTIGRSGDNDIVLNDFSVSRRHAILRHESGQWVIHDAASTNGVRVDDKLVQSASVGNGDQVVIGTFILRFSEEGEAPSGVLPRKRESTPTYPPASTVRFGLGDTVGRYSLLKEIGHGGSARVYLGRCADGDVAIKMFDLGKRSADAAGIYGFFKNELAAIRALNHPNIVRYLDAGVIDGAPYIAMELLSSGSLEEKVRRADFLAVGDVIDIVTPVAGALDYACEQHVLHRDIKPSNILFAADGRPVLSDFGIARFAPPREDTTAAFLPNLLGTSDFMAPEVMLEAPATPRSDIYSLGMTVYYCLSGRFPTDGKTPFTRSRDRVEGKLVPLAVRNPSIPIAVNDAVLRALSPNPLDRFPTARAFASALTVAYAEVPGHSAAPMPKLVTRGTGGARRWFAYWRYVLVPLLIALIGALAAWLGKK